MANERYELYSSNPDFAGVVIMWQNANFDRATTADCAALKRQYGLTMPVLVYANDNAARAVGFDERHVHLVTGPDARITHRAEGRDNTWQAAVDALLR